MCECYETIRNQYATANGVEPKSILIDSLIDADIAILKRGNKKRTHKKWIFKFCPNCGQRLWQAGA